MFISRTRLAVGSLLLAGAAVVALGATTRALRNHDRGGDGPAEVRVPDTDDLRAEVQQLRRQIGGLRSELAAARLVERAARAATDANEPQAERAAPLTRSGSHPREDDPEAKLPPAERAELAAARLYDRLDRQVATGAPDPAWRPEAGVREVLGHVEGARVGDVACARTICRIDVALAGGVDSRGISEQIARTPPFSDGVVYRHDPANAAHLILYLQRAGVPITDDDPKEPT